MESEERHEIIRILTKMAARIRPHVREILDSYHFLAQIDLIQAKAKMAAVMNAYEPELGRPSLYRLYQGAIRCWRRISKKDRASYRWTSC
jgi:dsDNA-specific endonuclease/ATPase MutS2